jgi:hypothetical protein
MSTMTLKLDGSTLAREIMKRALARWLPRLAARKEKRDLLKLALHS